MDQSVERIDMAGAAVPDIGDRRRWLLEGESLHRQLRPHLPPDYAGYIDRMLAEGTRLVQLVDGGGVAAIAVWRTYLTTFAGRRFEVDDLVTHESRRSLGHGRTIVDWLEGRARALDCPGIALNSSVQRNRAHRFYFRQGFSILAFHFVKDLLPLRFP